MFEQFSGDAPWLVLQNPWMLSTAVNYFLIKGCLRDQDYDLWGEENPIMYMSIITVIKPNGKVFTADKPVLPLLDRWGPKAYPFTVDRIKELEEEEWSQMETTSTLELLFYNQESVWDKVKEVLLQQKMICLFGGDGSQKGISMKEFTFFLRNVLIEFIDDIHIIYINGFDFKETKISNLTDATYVGYCPLQNPDMLKVEMEEMPLSKLLEQEAIRFWTHFHSLKEMVSKRDDNAKLKSILDSIAYHIPWMILIDKDGEIIIENGQDMISLCSESMEEKAKRLMQVLIKGSKEDREKALFELEQS